MKKLLLLIFFTAVCVISAQQVNPMRLLMTVSAQDSVADSVKIPVGHIPAAIYADSLTALGTDATFKVCFAKAGNGPWYSVVDTTVGSDTTAYNVRLKAATLVRLAPEVMNILVGGSNDKPIWFKAILDKKQTYSKKLYLLTKPLF